MTFHSRWWGAVLWVLGCSFLGSACAAKDSGTGTEGVKNTKVANTKVAASASASTLPPLVDEPLFGEPLAEIDLSAGAPEERSGGIFGEERATFFDLTAALQRLQEEGAPRGIFLRLSSGGVGWGRAHEVARALKKLREQGRVIVCHADGLGNGSYGLLAEGCGQIWVSPAGSVDTVGIGVELVFAKDLLANVGIEANIFQIGRYKGTGEMMTRSHASEEVKLSLQGALGSIREQWLQGVEEGRSGGMARAMVEKGPYTAQEARQLGLIDQVGYSAEALAALRRAVGGGRTEVVFGSRASGRQGKGATGILRAISGARRSAASRGGVVAVLRASGAIAMEASKGPLGGSEGIALRPFQKQLKKLAEDTSVKAVVLRIDSPGGSALASDLLWFDLIRLREKKPVIVSVGDMAASGGYYMACAGTKILAEESSIVGSIGVVGGKVALRGALERVGVNVEVIPADSSGDVGRAAYMSGMVPWDEGAKERAMASLRSVYDLFLQRVSQGRKKSLEEVASFAEGRIFSGREGLQRGMIDQLGGLQDAIDLAQREAGLDAESEVRLVQQNSPLEELLALGNSGVRSPTSLSSLLMGKEGSGVQEFVSWMPWAPELISQASSWKPMLQGEHALVALPFALLLR